MNNNRRRNFRGRQQKNNFRRRSPSNHSSNGHFSSNIGNKNFSRNGSLSNPSSIEKVILKYQQLAKDAQSSGDPVLIENYLQPYLDLKLLLYFQFLQLLHHKKK